MRLLMRYGRGTRCLHVEMPPGSPWSIDQQSAAREDRGVNTGFDQKQSGWQPAQAPTPARFSTTYKTHPAVNKDRRPITGLAPLWPAGHGVGRGFADCHRRNGTASCGNGWPGCAVAIGLPPGFAGREIIRRNIRPRCRHVDITPSGRRPIAMLFAWYNAGVPGAYGCRPWD